MGLEPSVGVARWFLVVVACGALGWSGVARAQSGSPEWDKKKALDAEADRKAKANDEQLKRAAESQRQLAQSQGAQGVQDKAVRAYKSAGVDVGLAVPFLESGWDPGLGLNVGVGHGGGRVRFDGSILRSSRKEGGQTLDKLRIPLFLGYRGPIVSRNLWWQLGGTIGYEKEGRLDPVLGKGDISCLFFGAAGGAGAGLPLGDFYLAASWLFHYDWRFSGGSDKLSDAEVSSFTSSHPVYQTIGLSIGYQSRW